MSLEQRQDAMGIAPRRAKDEALGRLLADYIGLYKRETLTEWRKLFLPGFTAASTNDDGSVTTRTLEEFYARQQGFFATGRPISEELQNVQSVRDGRLATVRAGFVLHDGDTARRGKLAMLIIEDRGQLKIASLIFTYHLDR